VDLSVSEQGFCEHGNEIPVSVNHDDLSNKFSRKTIILLHIN
jgi:hypothetical protein